MRTMEHIVGKGMGTNGSPEEALLGYFSNRLRLHEREDLRTDEV